MAISVNLNVLESMNYFWEATKGREKVGEQYIASIADMSEMAPLYDAEFTKESVRKLLSGISNREMFSWNKKEGRFWNNNMWIFEEYALMQSVLAKVKVLNLDGLTCFNGDMEVAIIPGHVDDSYRSENRITLNYFKLRVSEDGELMFGDENLVEYLKSQLA